MTAADGLVGTAEPAAHDGAAFDILRPSGWTDGDAPPSGDGFAGGRPDASGVSIVMRVTRGRVVRCR